MRARVRPRVDDVAEQAVPDEHDGPADRLDLPARGARSPRRASRPRAATLRSRRRRRRRAARARSRAASRRGRDPRRRPRTPGVRPPASSGVTPTRPSAVPGAVHEHDRQRSTVRRVAFINGKDIRSRRPRPRGRTDGGADRGDEPLPRLQQAPGGDLGGRTTTAGTRTHAQENIESPGFVNARRFAAHQSNGPSSPFEHLAVYEYEGDMERWRSDLDTAHRDAATSCCPSGSRRSSSAAGSAARERPAAAEDRTPAAERAMDALERLVAIQEIRDQIARYAIWFDDKNWETFATLWADDAAFEVNGMVFDGKAAVLEFLVNCLPERLQRQAHELDAARSSPMWPATARGRAPTSSGSPGLREPDRRPLRRRVRARRRPLAVRASHARSSCRSSRGRPPMSDTALAGQQRDHASRPDDDRERRSCR